MATIINWTRGDSGTISAQINDSGGTGYDLSLVDKATLSVKAAATDTDYEFQVSGNLPGGATGIITFTMLPRHTGYLIRNSDGTAGLVENLAGVQGGAGTLAAGTYYYRVSATNWRGETLACAEVASAAIVDNKAVDLTWDAVTGASAYKVYGRTTGAELLIATVTTNSYSDTGAVTPAGALPTADTTAMSAGSYVYDIELQWSSGATIFSPIISTFILANDITISTP